MLQLGLLQTSRNNPDQAEQSDLGLHFLFFIKLNFLAAEMSHLNNSLIFSGMQTLSQQVDGHSKHTDLYSKSVFDPKKHVFDCQNNDCRAQT